MDKNKTEKFAAQIRLQTIRQLGDRGFGHVGGAMSIIEALAVLYNDVMRVDPERPDMKDRDWLVCSKGHAGPALYATLALKGYFDQEMLSTLNQGGTNLPSHCDKNKTPGIDMTTGSLGQGVSTAIGVALGHKMDQCDNWVYLIVGDGELDEGQVWEGTLFANHYGIDNLIMFVDHNKQQLDGYIEDVMDLGDLCEKFASFGWHTQRIDGHDVLAIDQAIQVAKVSKGKPSVIVLDTVKGKGCTYAEGILNNHHMTISTEQTQQAIAEAQKVLEAFE